jgi:hypothetical protein
MAGCLIVGSARQSSIARLSILRSRDGSIARSPILHCRASRRAEDCYQLSRFLHQLLHLVPRRQRAVAQQLQPVQTLVRENGDSHLFRVRHLGKGGSPHFGSAVGALPRSPDHPITDRSIADRAITRFPIHQIYRRPRICWTCRMSRWNNAGGADAMYCSPYPRASSRRPSAASVTVRL